MRPLPHWRGGEALRGPEEASEVLRKIREQEEAIRRRMARVRHKVAVMSGKGGVGKSFISVNLAAALALMGRSVGLLDADLHGPSVPRLLGLRGAKVRGTPSGILPVAGPAGLKVMSIGFMLPSEGTPVIWRGPLKANVIREVLAATEWGDLDYLIVDLPPGTGDEPLSVVQLIRDLAGVVLVTIPSELSRSVVERALSFARQLGVRVLGVVENMSYFRCPRCGAVYRVFGEGAGRRVAEEAGVRFLGEVPLDPLASRCSDEGVLLVERYPDAEVSRAILRVAKAVLEEVEGGS